MSINNCSIFGNQYSSEYGLIYNNRGCIIAMNSVFSNAGCSIANFNTDDCVIFNCTCCSVVNDYDKYSMAEKVAIRTALMWGAGILSFATGFLGSGAVISFLPATVGILGSVLAQAGCAVVSGVVGGLIGVVAGLVDDAVIGGSERDHSNRGDIILQYAIIGAGCGFAGGLVGSFCPFFQQKEKNLEKYFQYERSKHETVNCELSDFVYNKLGNKKSNLEKILIMAERGFAEKYPDRYRYCMFEKMSFYVDRHDFLYVNIKYNYLSYSNNGNNMCTKSVQISLGDPWFYGWEN